MMETIRVNMTPCEDIKTIHASQNDGEAREWGFILHNNGDVIDSSEITDQMVFKAYKGGTEQILPENGGVPVTAPFNGDIEYPQGLLADQEFTYRQSPTESDGLAKITDIKGNTLVWNQLIQNGNFADTSNWRSSSNVSITASNNILRVTNAVGRDGDYYSAQNIPMKVGHKYYFHAEAKKTDVSTAQTLLLVFFGEGSNTFAIDAIKENTNWVSKSTIFTCASNIYNFVRLRTQVANATNEFRNVVLIDLTQMGLDITDPDEFTSLFDLPYYDFNAGTLLPFNGTGIKTTGKNKFNITRDIDITLSGVIFKSNADNSITVNGTTTGNATITQLNGFTAPNIRKGESLIWSGSLNRPVEQAYIQLVYKGDETGQTYSFVSVNNQSVLINATENMTLSGIYISCRSGNTFNNETFYPMLRYADSSDIYESYTESTASLPILTYFPTGMKSKGDIYDELTENKAITRIGSRAYQSGDEDDTSVITDGTTTYYALATPIETSFTTASLVTENGEVALANENGVLVGKCTEQLSSESGFFDAKIKLADEDGECYSNKIQLHIERSPQ